MKLSAEDIAKIRDTKKQELKEIKSWQDFINRMKAKGALISYKHGQTKIKF